MIEGSESGALVPSYTITEVETWVKFSNFPVEFLTSAALSMICSSIVSPVMMDEETYEKLENHKWPPKLCWKLHSRRTFVRILVRVSVTEPLRPTVDVLCPQGREYTIRIDYDPTPKVCLNCFCAGHFDFECCGTNKVSAESDAEAGGGFLDVNSQRADCFDGFRADINGEQGAVTTDGLDSFEGSTLVEAALKEDSHLLPAASCDFGAAAVPDMQPLLPATVHEVQGTVITEGSESYEDPPVLEMDPLNLPPAPCIFGAAVADLQAEVGELVAVQTISDGFDETFSVARSTAVLEVVPLLPRCDIGATELQAMIMADPCIVDDQFSGVFCTKQLHKDEQGLLEDYSGSGVGLLNVVKQGVNCLSGITAFIDSVHGAVIIDRAECHVFSPVVEADLAEIFHYIEQVFSVVNSPQKHHKWREKSDVQGLFCCSYGLGSFGFDEDHSGEYPCMIDVQAYSGVYRSNKLLLWCEILDDQGLFCIEVLDMLLILSRLVWNLAASYHDQMFFKIQHKWRDKGMLI